MNKKQIIKRMKSCSNHLNKIFTNKNLSTDAANDLFDKEVDEFKRLILKAIPNQVSLYSTKCISALTDISASDGFKILTGVSKLNTGANQVKEDMCLNYYDDIEDNSRYSDNLVNDCIATKYKMDYIILDLEHKTKHHIYSGVDINKHTKQFLSQYDCQNKYIVLDSRIINSYDYFELHGSHNKLKLLKKPNNIKLTLITYTTRKIASDDLQMLREIVCKKFHLPYAPRGLYTDLHIDKSSTYCISAVGYESKGKPYYKYIYPEVICDVAQYCNFEAKFALNCHLINDINGEKANMHQNEEIIKALKGTSYYTYNGFQLEACIYMNGIIHSFLKKKHIKLSNYLMDLYKYMSKKCNDDYIKLVGKDKGLKFINECKH